MKTPKTLPHDTAFLTKREAFALGAMKALVSCPEGNLEDHLENEGEDAFNDRITEWAVRMADSLIAALNASEKP